MSDGWGYDEGFAGAVTPVLDLMADRWWRLHVTGGESLPGGAALVVADHDGPRAYATAVLASALRRASGRVPRLLLPGGAFDVPFLAPAARRLGAVPLQEADALGLLREGQLVAMFCEGRHDTRFAELAVRAGVPVVPCALTELPYLRVPGPLRALPAPSRVAVALEAPLPPPATDPGDRTAVFDLADAVRERIAAGVHRNLVERGGGVT